MISIHLTYRIDRLNLSQVIENTNDKLHLKLGLPMPTLKRNDVILTLH